MKQLSEVLAEYEANALIKAGVTLIGRRGPATNLRPAGTHADQHRKTSRARAKRELRREIAEL